MRQRSLLIVEIVVGIVFRTATRTALMAERFFGLLFDGVFRDVNRAAIRHQRRPVRIEILPLFERRHVLQRGRTRFIRHGRRKNRLAVRSHLWIENNEIGTNFRDAFRREQRN